MCKQEKAHRDTFSLSNRRPALHLGTFFEPAALQFDAPTCRHSVLLPVCAANDGKKQAQCEISKSQEMLSVFTV